MGICILSAHINGHSTFDHDREPSYGKVEGHLNSIKDNGTSDTVSVLSLLRVGVYLTRILKLKGKKEDSKIHLMY